MLDRRASLSLMIAAGVAVGSAVAAPMRLSSVASGPRTGAPAEFVAQIDGPMTLAVGPGGRVWAAWAYRASGEFDVAVAFRDGAGPWSAPSYLGRRNLLDELEPAVAVDARGTVFVAFTTRGTGRVSLAMLPAGASAWLGPAIVSGPEVASAPAIRVVGDRLVVAYRTAAGVGIVDLPAGPGSDQVFGVQDGPDGADPLGLTPKWGGDIPPPVN